MLLLLYISVVHEIAISMDWNLIDKLKSQKDVKSVLAREVPIFTYFMCIVHW